MRTIVLAGLAVNGPGRQPWGQGATVNELSHDAYVKIAMMVLWGHVGTMSAPIFQIRGSAPEPRTFAVYVLLSIVSLLIGCGVGAFGPGWAGRMFGDSDGCEDPAGLALGHYVRD